MKLGFLLQITQAGNPSDGYSVNKSDEWARSTGDVRTSIKELRNYYGTEKVIYLVKFLGDKGYLICVIKASPEGSPRPDDNTAAWIFFPSKIEISAEETKSILETVEDAISAKMRTDYNQLERLFSREYKQKNVLISTADSITSPKDSSSYAIRYYSNEDYTLKELLGSSIAQPEYGKYKGILLVDKKLGIATSGQIITSEPKQVCTYTQLSQKDGFNPYVLCQEKFVSFSKPIEVLKGETVTVCWLKEEYTTIKKTFKAQADGNCPNSVMINPSDYKVIVKREHFQICDTENKLISKAEIKINGVAMNGDSMEVSESAYNEGVKLRVYADGYKDFKEENVKLSKKVKVYLKHNVYTYEVVIPLYEGKERVESASFSIETHHLYKSCPIKGYTTRDSNFSRSEVNRLEEDGVFRIKVKYFCYGILSVILAGLLYAGCQAMDDYDFKLGWPPIQKIEKKENSQPNQNNSKPQNNQKKTESTSVNTDSINAIKYLTKNTVWHKDSLDKHSITKGLFEELNSFNLEAIKKRKEAKLKDLPKLNDIIAKLSICMDPRTGKEKNNGLYNSASDKAINVDNYIKWLTEDHTPGFILPVNDMVDKPKTSETIKDIQKDTKNRADNSKKNKTDNNQKIKEDNHTNNSSVRQTIKGNNTTIKNQKQ